MATKIFFGRLFPKTLTSLTSFRSLVTLADMLKHESFDHVPNASALKLRNGCDYHPRKVVMQKYDDQDPFDDSGREPTKDEIYHDYVKKLAHLVGSEEEARMMVCSAHIHGYCNVFWTLLSAELYNRVLVLPRVSYIYPDIPLSRLTAVNSKNIDDKSLPMPDQMEEALARGEEFLDSSLPNKE